jgi:5-methylthioadenosine/S-adenosylhomocysteine deaminase
MIIKNGTILHFEDLSVEKADVLIEGNRIKKISESIEKEGEETIDAADFYVTSGFANSHAHVPMVLFRGSAEDVKTTDWFNKYIWIYEKNLTPYDIYIGALLGAAEMLLNGVTTVFDHYFEMQEVFKAFTEAGIRGDLAWAVFGTGENWEGNFKKALDFSEKFSGISDLITISLGPHSPYICPEDFLKKIVEISQKTGLKMHIHVSEEKWEIEKSLKEMGKTPIAYLKSLGVLREGTILAHAYYATDEDLKIIKEAGGRVAHAAKTYMRFGDVTNFLPRALKAGVDVALATDGPASNANLSIFEVARDAALLAKMSTRNAEEGRIGQIVPLISKGASFTGKKVGKVSEGYLADLVLINKKSVSLNPDTNIFANVLYSLSSRDIDTVIVNGKVVVRNGKLLTIDLDDVIKEARKSAKHLIVKKDDRPMQTFGK